MCERKGGKNQHKTTTHERQGQYDQNMTKKNYARKKCTFGQSIFSNRAFEKTVKNGMICYEFFIFVDEILWTTIDDDVCEFVYRERCVRGSMDDTRASSTGAARKNVIEEKCALKSGGRGDFSRDSS